MIRFSCHSENFGLKPADETFAFICQLGYSCVDVAARSLAPQEKIVQNPNAAAQTIKGCAQENGLFLSELFLGAVELDGAAMNPAAEKTVRSSDRVCRQFESICRFARQAGFSSIMGAAGNPQPEQSFEQSFENTVTMLTRQCEIAAQFGIAMHVEPTRTSLIREPENALRLAQQTPGLGYTLDFLHYHINGVGLDRSLTLLPLAGHLHIRQARFGTGKCRYEQGGIDYDAIVCQMRAIGWSGDVCSEFWCDSKMLEQGIFAVEQNLVMRYQIELLLRRYGLPVGQCR